MRGLLALIIAFFIGAGGYAWYLDQSTESSPESDAGSIVDDALISEEDTEFLGENCTREEPFTEVYLPEGDSNLRLPCGYEVAEMLQDASRPSYLAYRLSFSGTSDVPFIKEIRFSTEGSIRSFLSFCERARVTPDHPCATASSSLLSDFMKTAIVFGGLSNSGSLTSVNLLDTGGRAFMVSTMDGERVYATMIGDAKVDVHISLPEEDMTDAADRLMRLVRMEPAV